MLLLSPSVWPLDHYVAIALLHQAGNGCLCRWILQFFWDVVWHIDLHQLQQYTILICCLVATKFMIHLILWSAWDRDIFSCFLQMKMPFPFGLGYGLWVISLNNLGVEIDLSAVPLELDTSTVGLFWLGSGAQHCFIFYVWTAVQNNLIIRSVMLLTCCSGCVSCDRIHSFIIESYSSCLSETNVFFSFLRRSERLVFKLLIYIVKFSVFFSFFFWCPSGK